MTSSTTNGIAGQQGATDSGSDLNASSFVAKQALSSVNVMMPVRVVAVHGGGLGPAPTVDLMPLVRLMDGQGNATSHNTIYGVQAHRLQGGAYAIIADPVVGDIGHIVVSHRDWSATKASGGQESNPGSFRRFNLSDSVYHGAILNQGAPTQYVQFTSAGVTLVDAHGNVVTLKNGVLSLNPGSGGTVILGGDGTTGTYDFVSTPSGPSINTKARTG